MACECGSGRLHVYSQHTLLEIVDGEGRPVPAGVTGRILVTLLGNRGFPLIRYEIGDVGSLSDVSCPCGLPFPVLQSVEGRALECLTDSRGNFVSPVYVRHLVGVVHNTDNVIQRFQLNQLAAQLK